MTNKDYINTIKKGVEGFSLLELVIGVGIILVLTAGGLLSYNGIMNNARKAAVESAATDVMIYVLDANSINGTFEEKVEAINKAVDKWTNTNNNSNIKVEANKVKECLTVKAWNIKYDLETVVEKGKCSPDDLEEVDEPEVPIIGGGKEPEPTEPVETSPPVEETVGEVIVPDDYNVDEPVKTEFNVNIKSVSANTNEEKCYIKPSSTFVIDEITLGENAEVVSFDNMSENYIDIDCKDLSNVNFNIYSSSSDEQTIKPSDWDLDLSNPNDLEYFARGFWNYTEFEIGAYTTSPAMCFNEVSGEVIVDENGGYVIVEGSDNCMLEETYPDSFGYVKLSVPDLKYDWSGNTISFNVSGDIVHDKNTGIDFINSNGTVIKGGK